MAETETEDRTRAPSNRRRQEARERGQAAYSPELSGAAGLLAASAVLAIWGDGLMSSLVAAVSAPLSVAVPVSADAAEVVSRLRDAAIGLVWPFGLIVGAFAVGALAAHLSQTRALWAPVLIAPDPSRLWSVGQGGQFLSRAARGAWGLARVAAVVAVAAWVIRADGPAVHRLGGLDTPELVRAAGRSLRHLLFALSGSTLVLGLIDFTLQRRRFEAMLSLTPDEYREDLRSTEGDPAHRSRRRHLARSWRVDEPTLVDGPRIRDAGG